MGNNQVQANNKIKEASGLRIFLAQLFGSENNKETEKIAKEVEKIEMEQDKIGATKNIKELEARYGGYKVASKTKVPKVDKAKFSDSVNRNQKGVSTINKEKNTKDIEEQTR